MGVVSAGLSCIGLPLTRFCFLDKEDDGQAELRRDTEPGGGAVVGHAADREGGRQGGTWRDVCAAATVCGLCGRRDSSRASRVDPH